jgi:signal peptidase I
MAEPLECQGTELYELGMELAANGVSWRYEAQGWSMYPMIKAGDVLEVRPVPWRNVRVGDVLFYRSGERMLAHRVVGRCRDESEDSIRARGDAFLQEDPPICERDVIGRVDTIYRPGRSGLRTIDQERGPARWFGVLVARNKLVHRSLRWAARGLYRFEKTLKRTA